MEPLVSIIVITYNSEKYVLETLHSAYNQTYNNIELIISDDCSTDNTIKICKEWIENHKKRFIRTELLTIDKNTGIAPNCNRGLYKAHGEWVKLIAGDDILLENCIESNIIFIKNNNNAQFVFSEVNLISKKSIIITPTKHIIKEVFFNSDAIQQYKELVVNGNCLLAPTSFINREVLINLKGFDEKIPMLEDYTLWIKSTLKGYKLYYNPIITVNYRINSDSTMHSNSFLYRKSNYLNFIHYRSKYIFHLNYRNWYYLFINYYTNSKKNKSYKLLKLTSSKYLAKKILRK